MAHLQRRDPDQNGQGDIVRSWEAGTTGAPGASAGRPGVKGQVEELLDLLRRRKWLIVAVCLLAMTGAALYTYTQVPVYRTSSLVLVEKNQQSASESGLRAQAQSQGGGLLPSSSSLRNELMFLRNSQTLRERVAARLLEQGEARPLLASQGASPLGTLLDRVWASVGPRPGEAGEGTSAGGTSRMDTTQLSAASVAPALSGRVRFGRAGSETNVIQIVARDEAPAVARRLANLFTEEYIKLTQESSRARARASRTFLEQRSQKLERELETAEARIQRFQRREDAVSLDQRQGSLTERIATTESELEQARIELRMERSSLESLQKELESIQPDQLSQRLSSTVEEELASLQSEIANLELSKQQVELQSGRTTAADSAQAAQIDRRIRKLRARIETLSDRYVGEVMGGGLSPEEGARRVDELKRRIAEKRIQITGLESRVDVLEGRLQEFERELDAIPEKSMDLAQLKRDQKYAEQMYGFVTEQLQQARVREKSELGYATNISEAGLPGRPVRPRPQRNLILGLMLGLLGGAGLALLRDQMDNRLYKPDQIREMGYHGIGVIPNLTPLIEDQLGGQATVERDGHRLETGLVGVLKPYSAATEAYRKVWTNLQLGRPDGESGTVLVTSPGSGDGKSLTAANLAVIAAQAGHATLLVDGDLRRPRLHEVFDVSRDPGLTETLQNDLEEHAMKRPLADNLCVLPAGTEVESPAKVLGSARFREFLGEAEQYFDHIIVDSSPVLATADGPMLSDLCDTTLCVARAGTTTEDELNDTLKVLGEVGADVAGVVFNGFDLSMAYGYKYRYRHYGQYGPYDQYRSLPEDATA
ncbi:polysaccharide biosynthesis tyrosine autokinase [Salinibacter altiplanensis]|uniref:polysaccharide biosynthesis tyrosine autokinase n=1 Tax=Salinibacter altiplanensis TaxID=1803181 RepID=UPI0018E463EA|nr:polysaccharide biosynthesis tyrosine autokinase [Salinibacter altiplanensis]